MANNEDREKNQGRKAQAVKKIGRPRIIESPAEMERLVAEYVTKCQDTLNTRQDWVQPEENNMVTTKGSTAGVALGAYEVPTPTDESSRLVHGFVSEQYDLGVLARQYLEDIHATRCVNEEETGSSIGERVTAFALGRLAAIGSILGRDELGRALAACRLHGATLVIAKLDRLSRNVAFIAALMDSGVDFVAVDFPQANRLTVHILAAVAEHERAMISQRTKEALAAAKARGVKLGNDNLTDAARAKGRVASALALAKRAKGRAALVIPTIRELQAGGASLHKVAEALNSKGVPAPRGGAWYGSSVRNALRLADDA